MCNIQIPIYLGDVVTVLTELIRRDVERTFADAIQAPAVKLVALYAAQVGRAGRVAESIFRISKISLRGIVHLAA